MHERIKVLDSYIQSYESVRINIETKWNKTYLIIKK
jgi:hypothetical protein